jgi:hypothetical protein
MSNRMPRRPVPRAVSMSSTVSINRYSSGRAASQRRKNSSIVGVFDAGTASNPTFSVTTCVPAAR